MVIHDGEEFNRKNATLDEDYERAVDHVEFFVDWIWGISKNGAGVTNLLIRAGDSETSNTRINATKIASWDLPIQRRTPNHRHQIQLMFCASLRKAFHAKIEVLKRKII